MSVLRDITTGYDNETYDPVRIMALMAALVATGLEIYVVGFKNQPLNLIDFGTGMGLILGAGAGGMWARKDFDRPPPPEHDILDELPRGPRDPRSD